MLDGLLAAEQLPEEYRDRCQVNLPFSQSRFHSVIHLTLRLSSLRDCFRIYCVTTAREKAGHGFIGCTTSVVSVVLTTPELSRLIRQSVLALYNFFYAIHLYIYRRGRNLVTVGVIVFYRVNWGRNPAWMYYEEKVTAHEESENYSLPSQTNCISTI
jgi:hypothetical protein